MRRHWTALAAIVFLTVAARAQDGSGSDDSPMPGLSPRTYFPASNNTDFILGTMRLGTQFASFTLLRGHMDLSFGGEMPEPDGMGVVGKMQMFRVTNAQAFWSANKGKNGFCPRPVEWLGVVRLPGDDIRVEFFDVRGKKGLLDETVHFRDNEEGGLGLCSADTFDDGRVRTYSGQEVYQTAMAIPMASADVRRMIVGAWILPDRNPDKLPEAALQVAQVFRRNGTGVMLPYEHAACGSTPVRRFSWAIRGDAIWITNVRPAANEKDDLLIGPGPTRVIRARTPGFFNSGEHNFTLAFVPQCGRRD